MKIQTVNSTTSFQAKTKLPAGTKLTRQQIRNEINKAIDDANRLHRDVRDLVFGNISPKEYEKMHPSKKVVIVGK